jgi:hypothetical protein
MKGLDVLIVRFMPFLLYIIIGIQLWRCWLGIDYYPFNLLHSNSTFYSLALFLISLANKRYHCIWNRAMYLFLIATPVFNYLDAKFLIFENVDNYLIVIITTYFLVLLITAYLAIRHFIQISKRRMERGK